MEKKLFFALICAIVIATIAVAQKPAKSSKKAKPKSTQTLLGVKNKVDSMLPDLRAELSKKQDEMDIPWDIRFDLIPVLDGPFSKVAQNVLFAMGKPVLIKKYIEQNDTDKANDQFLVYRLGLYLKQFDLKKEKKRDDTSWHTFRFKDWNGKNDPAGVYYARCYCRIVAGGVKLQDLRDRQKELATLAERYATKESRKIYKVWVDAYKKGEIAWEDDDEVPEGSDESW